MSRFNARTWLPLLAILLSACSDGSPTAPADDLGLPGDQAMATVLPDLTPEPGSEGTDRYVPTLERILIRAVRVIREKAGDGAAGKVVAEARSLHQAVRTAREAQNQQALEEALRKLEGFEARVGLRVFGAGVVRHVHADAAKRLDALAARIKAAADAGKDVTRAQQAAQTVRRHLAAARDAAGKQQMVAALVHAAHALDLVTRVAAAF